MVIMISASSILEVDAQSYVTYNHDAAKMNQITVQEIGAGGLTPAFYYDVFHRSYQKTAASKNKLTYRSLAGVAGWQQVDDADSVKGSFEKRAEVEALNVADRQVDIAWLAEGTKITNKLSDAYMPNAQRKKEYLAIYADICKENETLVKFIVQLSHRTRTKSLLEATGSRPNHNGVHASSAFSRWRNAGWKTQSGGGSSTDDSNTESGTTVIDENP